MRIIKGTLIQSGLLMCCLSLLTFSVRADVSITLPQAKSSDALLVLFSPKTTVQRERHPGFDLSLRAAIRAEVLASPLFQPELLTRKPAEEGRVTISMAWETELLVPKVLARLQTLDAGMQPYLHISQKNSTFEQLKQFMPALYELEERKALLHLLALNKVRQPVLAYSHLAARLDKQISRLANNLRFRMKPLVRESKEYESELIAAIDQQGIRFSVRPPDFLLDYQLYSHGQDETSGAWLFDAEVTLLDKHGLKIVSSALALSEQASSEQQAERQALREIAQAIGENLRAFLLEKH